MSIVFETGATQLSSSASSSFMSDEVHSNPRMGPAGEGRTGDHGVNAPASGTGPAGPGGPNALHINKAGGGRQGASERAGTGGSPLSRGSGRFVDPKDENGYAVYGRRMNTAAATPTTVAAPMASSGRTASPTSPVHSAAAPLNVRAGQAPSGAGTGGDAEVPPAVSEYARQLSDNYFKCAMCGRVVQDAVLLNQQMMTLVCRRCCLSVPGNTPLELPKQLRDAVRSVKAAGGMPESNDDVIGERRILRAKRLGPGVNAPSGVTNSGRGAGAQFAGASATSPNSNAPLLSELTDAEAAERQQIHGAEASNRAEIASRRTAEGLKRAFVVGGSGGGGSAAASASASAANASKIPPVTTSRQYKLEADRKYEGAEYTAALELYTKAITVQPVDKLSNLKFLYGNRSAAFYMAQRYQDCISDCLEVVRLEPTNTKMVSRAARAACTMGDLQRSVEILLEMPADRRSEENDADLARYQASLETFRHAERCFGAAEGDEQYRMLVAQYSDAVPFRVRSAESLRKQKHYMRAVEVLETLSYSARTPATCRIMSECLYLSGFEHFERAKKCITDAAQLDDGCQALLQKIEAVDDGKQHGNSNFNKKNYGPAAEYYTAAIQAASDNEQVLRVLYCNRAAAYKELGRYREGVEDCTKTLAIDKEFFKAYARRARCHEHLGDHFAAVRDYRKAIEYDSNDRELARELRAAEQSLAKEAEREKDFYYQLGVTRNSTEREVKVKYRELSLRWHPDKCIGFDEMERERAEHKFKIVSEAYATLVDPVKRREYDMKQDREKFTRPGGYGFASTYSGSNASSNEYFRGRPRAGANGFW